MLIQKCISQAIKNHLKEFIEESALEGLLKIELPKNANYGDLSTTAPLALSKLLKKAPLQIANQLKDAIADELKPYCEIEVVPPGFLNFRLKTKAYFQTLQQLNTAELVEQKTDQESLLVEYVSANPTGDLHLGHGRGAVVGSALVSILKACGKPVISEFYINDAGEQMQKLGRSAWSLYTQTPSQGEEYPPELIKPHLKGIENGFTEIELTERVKTKILEKQKAVLASLNVHFDRWVSEKEDLHKNGLLQKTLDDLKKRSLTYEKDGATWLKSAELGDERDRVLIKSEGARPTYLAGDIAYHLNKFERADSLLDIFGADHHGQEKSLQVALKAFDKDLTKFNILFIQFVSLMEGGEEVKMSKRTGAVITVDEVLEKVGSDAFRFMLLQSHVNNRLTFDIDLAKRTDDQNPVFYVQYAHARACNVLKKAFAPSLEEQKVLCNEEELQKAILDEAIFATCLSDELSEKEIDSTQKLILKLSCFNQEVHYAAETLNPSSLAHYLIDIANHLHSFYTFCRAINYDNKVLSLARLSLIKAVQKVLQNGLSLLLVSAPKKM